MSNVIKPWTDEIEAHVSEADAVHGATKALAVAKLFRTVGGTKRRIARKTLRMKDRQDDVVDGRSGAIFTIDRIVTHVEPGAAKVTIYIMKK